MYILSINSGVKFSPSLLNKTEYQLSTVEYTALSYGLDHHISTKLNNNRIHTEFKQFYQDILKDISHIPEKYLSSLKTKLWSTCEKYSKIHVPYKYKKIIDQLSRNKDLCILEQDKRRCVNGRNQIYKQMFRNTWNKSVYKTKPWSYKISWRKDTTIIEKV